MSCVLNLASEDENLAILTNLSIFAAFAKHSY